MTPAQQFQQYAALLLEENKKYNLTAITSPEEIQRKHFDDSLLLLDILREAPACSSLLPPESSLLDVGSGAGFPGAPLCIARPDLRVTLLESTGKKAAFLRLLGERLGLAFEVVQARAEEEAHRPALRGQFDWAVSRAVAALPVLCELCLPFLRIGGHFAAYKGLRATALQELEASRAALEILGAELAAVESRQTPCGERTLVLCRKISQTPGLYPRNHGAMLKKPL